MTPSAPLPNEGPTSSPLPAPDAPLPESKSDAVAFAANEYYRRVFEGNPPDVHEWCNSFPEYRTSLLKILGMDACLGSQIDGLVEEEGSGDESIPWPLAGEEREGFTILRELGRGGFARVYLAIEAATGDRPVVLKCSKLGGTEARMLGRLTHPGIVPILSAPLDQRSGLRLVCMPYLGSTTLADVLDRASPARPERAAFFLEVIRSRAQPEDPPAAAPDARLQTGSYTDGIIHLAIQLAQTLAFLHERGVCHRDLKPSNILLDSSGKPLLLDFNLSHSEQQDAVGIGGTLRYMPPEQLRAYLDRRKDGLDARADLFALGVMIYELLGGEHPCPPASADGFGPELAKAALEGLAAGFQPFKDVCPYLERPVAAVLDRCLALDAAKRLGSAAELAAELQRQFTPARRLRRWLAARRRWVLAAASLLVLTVTVLVAVWAVTPPYSQREYERGRTAYHSGDYEAAEMHFDHACRAAPEDVRFRRARGCARLQRSKFLPREQVQFDPIWDDLASKEQGAIDPQTLALLAYIKLRRQSFDEAIEMYSQPVLSGYRPVMVLNNRAYAYLSKCQLDKARVDLDQAIEVAPKLQAPRYNRASLAIQLRLQQRRTAIPLKALEDVEQAIQSGPQTSALYRNAAILHALAAEDHHSQADFAQALSYLRQALANGEPPIRFHFPQSLRNALKRPDLAALVPSSPPSSSRQPDLGLMDPVDLPE